MTFQEYSAQLPVGRGSHRDTMSFDVDVDVDTHEVLDIYTNRSNYEDLPTVLQRLEWTQGRNALFIHVSKSDCAEAWKYLHHHAILDDELEELLNS